MAKAEFARVTGTYSTAFIGEWQLIRQSVSDNYSVIRLYGSFYYGGQEHVSSSYSTFKLNNTTIKSGGYYYTPGTLH